MAEVILDAGPLVAYLDKREEHHDWAVGEFEKLSGHVISCEAVITEVCFLLEGQERALAKVADYLSRGIIRLEFALSAAHARVFDLMRKYADQPMSLTDACLVCMAEEAPRACVFTVDSDFKTYRLRNGKTVPLIAPW